MIIIWPALITMILIQIHQHAAFFSNRICRVSLYNRKIKSSEDNLSLFLLFRFTMITISAGGDNLYPAID